MKNTTFTFWLKPRNQDHAAELQAIKDKIATFKGVVSVDSRFDGYRIDLLVHVEFESVATVERLHPKIMRFLMKQDEMRMTGVSTRLSDLI